MARNLLHLELRGLVLALAAITAVTDCRTAVAAAVKPAPTQSAVPLVVALDRAEVIHLSRPAKTIFVANPDVADVFTQSATSVLVYGKKTGTTTVYALSSGDAATSYPVQVVYPSDDVNAAIARGGSTSAVDVASTPGGMLVTGTVTTPAEAHRIRALARQFLKDKGQLAFDVGVDQSTQVNLRVRVVEVSRQAETNFGFNWSTAFNNDSIAIGLLTGRPPPQPHHQRDDRRNIIELWRLCARLLQPWSFVAWFWLSQQGRIG